MTIDSEKYKELYNYHKDQFESECARYDRLEDKSARYLSSITFLMGAYVLLVQWTIDKVIPLSGVISWLVISSIVITFIAMISSWSFIFRSIRLQDLKKMPIGDEVINYFKNNKKSTVYLGMAKNYSKATKAKETEYTKKLHYVKKGYEEIVFTGWCFVISVFLIFINIFKG